MAVEPENIPFERLEVLEQLERLERFERIEALRESLNSSVPMDRSQFARTATQAAPVLTSVGDLEIEFAGRGELILLWKSVRENYLDLSKHEAFLAACLEARNLIYPARKYSGILEVAPTEETAIMMRNRIVGYAGAHMESAAPSLSRSTWKMPLPSFNSLILLLGTIAVVVGIGFPNMLDVAKLGGAMIALSLGLNYFLRRPV